MALKNSHDPIRETLHWIEIPAEILSQIQRNGQLAYPEEGAGLLLGFADAGRKQVNAIIELPNSREDGARHNRYLITPQAILKGEQQALALGMDIIGVFHSHPDHPNQPSDFDREWAMPWYSYLITSVINGVAIESRSWRLLEDRSSFVEEMILAGL
jgi:proteasome lid subunit RPN8/RPN11